MKITKKNIAIERLILITTCIFTILILPIIVSIFSRNSLSKTYDNMFRDFGEALEVFLILYLILQLIRSIIRSIKIIKKQKTKTKKLKIKFKKNIIIPIAIAIIVIIISSIQIKNREYLKNENESLEETLNECNQMIEDIKSRARSSYEEMGSALEILNTCEYKKSNLDLDLELDLELGDLDL